MKIIDMGSLYDGAAKLSEPESYIEKAREMAGAGEEVVFAGQGTVALPVPTC